MRGGTPAYKPKEKKQINKSQKIAQQAMLPASGVVNLRSVSQ